jgi:hypothetical protein
MLSRRVPEEVADYPLGKSASVYIGKGALAKDPHQVQALNQPLPQVSRALQRLTMERGMARLVRWHVERRVNAR